MMMTTSTVASKKVKNLEKRREKSRFAARHRREKESAIYGSLCEIIPFLYDPSVTHVDRIAVLRLAACYFRARHAAENVFVGLPCDSRQSSNVLTELEEELIQCSDGFLCFLDNNGHVIYVSKGVSAVLGLTQKDVIGHNIQEYLHNDDNSNLVQIMNEKPTGDKKGKELWNEVTLRIKSFLTSRGRNLNLRSLVYRAVSCNVASLPIIDPSLRTHEVASVKEEQPIGDDETGDDLDDVVNFERETSSPGCTSPRAPKTPQAKGYFVLYGTPISNPMNIERAEEAPFFMSRHSMDMRFSYCHEKIAEVLGYSMQYLIGVSFFSLLHADDLKKIVLSMKRLDSQGQVVLGLYRLLVFGGGYVWLYSEASMVSHNARVSKGKYIVCVHQLISVPTKENRAVFASVQTGIPTPVLAIKQNCFANNIIGYNTRPQSLHDGDDVGNSRRFLHTNGTIADCAPVVPQPLTHSPTRTVNTGFIAPPLSSPSNCSSNGSSAPSLSPPDNINRAVLNVEQEQALQDFISMEDKELLASLDLGLPPLDANNQLCPDIDISQIDDLSLLAPFVAPNEVLSLEIPLEPFDANFANSCDFPDISITGSTYSGDVTPQSYYAARVKQEPPDLDLPSTSNGSAIPKETSFSYPNDGACTSAICSTMDSYYASAQGYNCTAGNVQQPSSSASLLATPQQFTTSLSYYAAKVPEHLPLRECSSYPTPAVGGLAYFDSRIANNNNSTSYQRVISSSASPTFSKHVGVSRGVNYSAPVNVTNNTVQQTSGASYYRGCANGNQLSAQQYYSSLQARQPSLMTYSGPVSDPTPVQRQRVLSYDDSAAYRQMSNQRFNQFARQSLSRPNPNAR